MVLSGPERSAEHGAARPLHFQHRRNGTIDERGSWLGVSYLLVDKYHLFDFFQSAGEFKFPSKTKRQARATSC